MGAIATTSARPRNARERRRPLPRQHGVRLFERGRATLDDRITALWAQLVVSGKADCPVCGTEVAAGSECEGCGSELS